MTLDGVTPFPAEFADRYRAQGYWEDRPLFDGFTGALAVPAAARGFDFTAMAADIMAGHPGLGLCLVQGAEGPLPDSRFLRLEDLLERAPRASARALSEVRIDPADPALFLLSGGTTGIPKLIPRTHNDYLYNSKAAAACR